MIISFGNQATADLFNGIKSRESRKLPSEIAKIALKKLDILNAAEQLDELKVPPGNRLEHRFSIHTKSGLTTPFYR